MIRTASTSRLFLMIAACCLASFAADRAAADNYVPQGPFVFPGAGPGIPSPNQVPGKEYSDYRDKDAADPPAADPLRVLNFDGAGGTSNGFNYSGSFLGPTGEPIHDPGREVDALSAFGDALFGAVVNNQSALLLSAQGDPVAPVRVHSTAGAVGVWATIGQVDAPGLNDPGVVDLDGLEVWGAEPPGNDATLFSLEGDPGFVSIWRYSPSLHQSTPFITASQIAGALGDPDLLPFIDLDGLMVASEEILFSLRPTPGGPFDGGEIWYWDMTNPLATFLVHGGRVWDTANDVTSLLGSENVDALEAVSTIPEPSTVVLGALSLVGLVVFARRKR